MTGDLTVENVETLAEGLYKNPAVHLLPPKAYRAIAQHLIDSGVVRLVADVWDEAIKEVADRWQTGAWADVLTKPVPPGGLPALTRGQEVLEWLRAQA